MNIKILNNKYAASFLLVLTAFALYVSPFYVRILSIFLWSFSIIPLFYTAVKFEFKVYAPSILILLLISIFFFKNLSIYIFINLIIPMMIFKFTFKDFKLISYTRSYYSLIIYSLSITILLILLLQTKYINEIFQSNLKTLNNTMDILIQNLKSQNMPDSDIIKMEKMKLVLIASIKNYFPSMIFYFLSIFLTMNFIISIFFISKYAVKKPVFINIFFIKTPEHYIWIFLFACLSVFISFYYKNPLFRIITVNFAMICSFNYIIIGALILLYRFITFKINLFLKFLILFVILQLSIMYFKYAFLVFSGIGILDYWFDFRKMKFINKNNIDTLV